MPFEFCQHNHNDTPNNKIFLTILTVRPIGPRLGPAYRRNKDFQKSKFVEKGDQN